MPIKSFIAHPLPNRKTDLISDLEEIEECEVIPSTNEDVVVIVTETHDKQSDIALIDRLNTLDSIQMLSMVSGFDNKVQN